MHEVKDAFDALARAPGKTKWLNDNSFMKQNPITKERTPSCQVTLKDGRIWFHDWGSGISFKEFCEALGVDYCAAIGNSKKRTRHSIADRIAYGFRDYLGEGVRATIYDYTDEEYSYLYSRVRLEGGSKQDGEHRRKKEFYFYLIDYAGETYQKCDENKGIKIPRRVLYRLPKLIQALNAGRTVYIAEGEKDIHTLESLGYTATCAGASGDWKPEYGRYFKGARVVICPDNDTAGKNYLETVLRSLKWYAHSVKAVLTCRREGGDISDFITDGNSKESFESLVNEAETVYAPWIEASLCKGKPSLKVNSDLLSEVILRNEPHLLSRNPADDKDALYFYGADGFYQRCNRNELKSRIKQYLPLGIASDNALNNTANLMLASVSPDRIVSADDLDSDERVIVLRNGVYNLDTRQLEPFTSNRFITRTLHCSFTESDKIPERFIEFLRTLCTRSGGTVDEDAIKVLQEFMGLALSNFPGYRIKKALMLVGSGNTGKSVLLNLLIALIDPMNVCNIALRDMTEASRFAVGSAAGKRMIAIGDESSSEIRDTAIFKQLTGGDLIKFEEKGKQPQYRQFRGVITLAVNNLPSISDDKGSHLFERFMMIPCENVVPEDERDPFLLEKLLQERDLIFMWALKGLHRLIDNNFRFTKCDASDNASLEYRSKLDSIYRFINESEYEITGNQSDKISKAEFETAYTKWCEENEYTPVSRRNIKDRMIGLGVPVAKADLGAQRNVMVYRKIKRNDVFMDFKDETEPVFH